MHDDDMIRTYFELKKKSDMLGLIQTFRVCITISLKRNGTLFFSIHLLLYKIFLLNFFRLSTSLFNKNSHLDDYHKGCFVRFRLHKLFDINFGGLNISFQIFFFYFFLDF